MLKINFKVLKLKKNFNFNLKRLATLCLLIIYLFSFNSVNCQDTSQVHSLREIQKLNSYNNAQIFRFWIPKDTSLATWSFWSNTSLNCDFVNVTVYLRWKGIPVINFDNITEPNVYIDEEQQYKIKFIAGGYDYNFNISNPMFGEWFALAYFEKNLVFKNSKDQVINKIIEKTQIFDCKAWLNSHLTFKRHKRITKLSSEITHVQQIHNFKIFRFFIPINAFNVKINITDCKTEEKKPFEGNYYSCPISLYIRGSGIPDEKVNDNHIKCSNLKGKCFLKQLDMVRNQWNYLMIKQENFNDNTKTQIKLKITIENCQENISLDDYVNNIQMIITTPAEIQDSATNSYLLVDKENLFVAKKRAQTTTTQKPLSFINFKNEFEDSFTTELKKYSTSTPKSTTTSTTTSATTTTTSTTTTTTTTTTPSTTTFSTLPSTTSSEPTTIKIIRNKKPFYESTIKPTTLKPTTESSKKDNFKYIDSATDISAASDKSFDYSKLLKQNKNQPKIEYSSENLNFDSNKKVEKNKEKFDKEFDQNLEPSNNEKDYEEDVEDDVEEDEDAVSEENIEDSETEFKNKYKGRTHGQVNNKYSNQNNIYKNHINNHNNHKKNQYIQRKKEDNFDDEDEINKFTKERASKRNEFEFDFTRKNSSIRNRIGRAAWNFQNSFFATKLSELNLVEQCPYRLSLIRHNLPGNFNFKYAQLIKSNFRHGEAYIQVPNTNINQLENQKTKLSLIQFEVIPLLDAGGSLEIELGLNIDFDYQVNNVSVIACISHNKIATSLTSCFNKLQVNSSNLHQNQLSRSYIPYPKSGNWFISIIAFCHKNIQNYNPSSSNQFNNGQIEQDFKECDRKYSSVLLNIKSASCNEDNCPAKRGVCQNQLQNGLLFSNCQCRKGFYGFECKEKLNDFNKEVQQQLLSELLVLSLSNVLWIPTVIIASHKSLWVESLIYFMTMFLSTSFHVCSSTSNYSMCLMNPMTLELGCLFISCLCVCITLVSLSDMSASLKCILHMSAAVWVALLIHLKWSSFWMYTISSVLFSLIMLTSWLVNCCRGTCFPSCKLWFFSIIPAFVCLSGAFAILLYPQLASQWIIDSVFNVLLPVSVLFLLYSINNHGKMMVSQSSSSTHVGTRTKDGHLIGKGISSETYYELIAEEASHLARHPLK